MRKIIGVTVGTPMNPSKIVDRINPVKTVNGVAPDENGNVEVNCNLPPVTESDNGKVLKVVAGEWQAAAGGGADAPPANDVDIQQAINEALAQAKASGEFDGADGNDGIDGIDGKDGYTPVKGVDYFDGKDGRDGVDGKDGYTPVKGVDYFDGKDGADGEKGDKGDPYTLTDTDKANIAAAVKASLPTETWTFTLEDGSTVTKAVYVG